MGVLTVHLDRVSNITNKDLIGKTDPYVRFELEQDNFFKDVDYGYQFSSKKRNDCNPVYNETFTWQIPTLDNMVLTCKIMDEDKFSRDDKCGPCKVKLEHLGVASRPKAVEKTFDRNLFTANGKIHLRISFTK